MTIPTEKGKIAADIVIVIVGIIIDSAIAMVAVVGVTSTGTTRVGSFLDVDGRSVLGTRCRS